MAQRTADKRTIEEKKAAFLHTLAQKGTITVAARLAGMGRTAVYKYREEDPEFAAGWDDAQEQATDKLEQSMFDRALKGDTTAGIFILKGRRPEKFRETIRNEHMGAGGGPVKVQHDHGDALTRALDTLAAFAAERGAAILSGATEPGGTDRPHE